MVFRCMALALVLNLAAIVAHADPYVQAKGQGRVLITAINNKSARSFNDHGHIADANRYDQQELYVSAEYGLSDDLTLVINPSYRNARMENAGSVRGMNYTEVGLRRRLAHDASWIVSTQVLARVPGQRRSGQAAQTGNTSTDLDLRLGGAYGTTRTFVTAEGGYRLRSGRQANEFHADFTAGWHANSRLMLLASLYNTWSDGRSTAGSLEQKYNYGDFFLNAAYQINDRVSVMLGYRMTVYGRNALRQRGPLLGFWITF